MPTSHLQHEEAAAPSKAQNVADTETAVGAWRNLRLVEEGAVRAAEVIDVEAGLGTILVPICVGRRPVLEHSVVSRHRRVRQGKVAVWRAPYQVPAPAT